MVFAVGAMWASMMSCFTPTVLFVIINLVIGTIAITSKLHHNTNHGREAEHHHRPRGHLFSRASSVLAQLQSINLHRYVADANPTLPADALQVPPEVAPTEMAGEKKEEEEEEEEYGGFETLEEAYAAATSTSKGRYGNLGSQSDAHPAVETTTKEKKVKVTKISNSTTSTTAMLHECGEGMAAEARRPKSRQPNVDVEKDATADGGSEVDARADDFINRFRRQLRLQRLNSILRSKEMLNRGR